MRSLVERSVAAGAPIAHTLILVGGNALAAHGIRALSEDVDVFTREFSDDIVANLEAELREQYGPAFKLDVTSGENLWGSILVRDIGSDAQTVLDTLELQGERFEIRALGIETLFLLKLAADRARDRDDLTLIAPKTTPERLIARFNQLIGWHGDRHAIVAFADALLLQLRDLYGRAPHDVIEELGVPNYVRSMLWDTYGIP